MNAVRLASSLVLLSAVVGSLGAQAGTSASSAVLPQASKRFDSRAELEALARQAESQKRTSEAWLLRQRLEKGDFQEGDRVVVVLEGATMVLDTLQVRTGKVLQFPRMGDLSLEGVLRSELTEKIRSHLAKFLTAPVVRAMPLLPVAVMGAVNRPGFYDAPADVVLRDVIMSAGGPTSNADLNKVEVRRSGEVIWKPQDVRVALTDGLTLDGLHLRAGDEIYVAQRRQLQMQTLVTIISTSVATILAIISLSN